MQLLLKHGLVIAPALEGWDLARLLSVKEMREVADVVLFGKVSSKEVSREEVMEEKRVEEEEEEVLEPLDPDLINYPRSTRPSSPHTPPNSSPCHASKSQTKPLSKNQAKNKAARMLNIKLSSKKETLYNQLLTQSRTQSILTHQGGRLSLLPTRIKKLDESIKRKVGCLIYFPRRIRDMMEILLVLYLRPRHLPDKTSDPLIQWPLLSRIGVKPCPDFTFSRTQFFSDKIVFEGYYLSLKIKQAAEELVDNPPVFFEYVDACSIESWFEEECRLFQSGCDGDEFSHWIKKEYHPGRILCEVLQLKCHIHASLKEYDEEADILSKLLRQRVFCGGDRPRLFSRLSLVLHFHLRRSVDARSVCLEALEEDGCVRGGYRRELLLRLSSIEQSLNLSPSERFFECLSLEGEEETKVITIQGLKLKTTRKGKSTWKPTTKHPAQIISVEEVALEHFRGQGWLGAHLEGKFLGVVVGLASLDVLLEHLPGSFSHPDECFPVDLFAPFFYRRRARSVEVLLERLEKKGVEHVLANYDLYKGRGKMSSNLWGVDFSFPREDLEEICVNLGNVGIQKLTSVVLKDVRGFFGGFPDLTCWKKDGSGILFVEVKGPGDRLMKTQEVWLQTLQTLGFACCVCRVESK